MKLHEDKEQLADAIRITAAELGIPQKFVEKDFWICRYFRICRDVLRRMNGMKALISVGRSWLKCLTTVPLSK